MIEVITKPAIVQAFPDLGKYCTYNQAIRSDEGKKLGLLNTPTDEDYERMQYTYEHAIVPVFDKFGPGAINSFFRSALLEPIKGSKRMTSVNAAVGGATSSNHRLGMAVDLDYDNVKGVTNVQVFDWIRNNIPFYELISENPEPKTNNPKWVHIAVNKNFPNRKLVKRMIYDSKGEKQYQLWPWKWAAAA